MRYVGEPVVAVAAESADIAAEALTRVRVRYRELPMAATVDEALAPDAPVLHDTNALAGEYHELAALEEEAPRNVCHHERLEDGDLAAGFEQADAVFEDTFEFPMICHYSLEPHTAVARFEGDEIALWTSSAHPFLIRAELAQMFRVPMPNVRVTVPYVGGAFGGKSYFKIEPLAVALARTAAGRPVRLAQSASESMLTIRRHSARCRVKTGVRRDGTVVAREAELHLDTGAYADNGPRVAKRVATRIHGPYRIPHYRIDVYAVYTNTAPAGSMRSIGGPQSIFPLESHMDDIARGLEIDPLAFRLKNLLHRDEPLKPGAKPMDADLHMDLRKVGAMVGWDEKQGAPADNLGIAVGVTDSEAMPVSTAILRLLSDGSVVLMAGSTEVGQGARTVLSQGGGRGAGPFTGTHRHARHQYRRDPVRPLHRRQPLHHRHGNRGQIRGRGPGRADPEGRRRGPGVASRGTSPWRTGGPRPAAGAWTTARSCANTSPCPAASSSAAATCAPAAASPPSSRCSGRPAWGRRP